jgi:hypothetical protein
VIKIKIRKREAMVLPKIVVLLAMVTFAIAFFGVTMFYFQRTPNAAEGFGLLIATTLVSLLNI